MSAVFGSVLLIRGLQRRSFRGTVMALLGGWLLVRAVGGATEVRDTIGSLTERAASRSRAAETDAVTVSRSITVDQPVDELYDAWRDPDRLTRIWGPVSAVTASDDHRLTWTVHGPLGRNVAVTTRLTADEPGERLQWETPADVALPMTVTVGFRPAPGDRGTIVTLTMRFDPPGGTLGRRTLGRLDVVPETAVGTVLDRFKSLVETGEIPTLEANPSGRGRGDRL